MILCVKAPYTFMIHSVHAHTHTNTYLHIHIHTHTHTRHMHIYTHKYIHTLGICSDYEALSVGWGEQVGGVHASIEIVCVCRVFLCARLCVGMGNACLFGDLCVYVICFCVRA